MYKLVFLFCCLGFLACNSNQSSDSTENKSSDTNAATASTTPPNMIKSLPPQSELEIISGCVDNAKAQLGEPKAYALCKCVLAQVQQKYPNADSSAIVSHLSDSAEVTQFAAQCK